jgi:chorismate-pyruvate lyase
MMLDIRDLGMIPRILFATDGAITHILEAYAGEPVDLVRLDSRVTADEGERAFVACSLLQGRTSRRVFVHAASHVLLDRVPPAVSDELLRTGTSILKLLVHHRVGTFRECVAEWEGRDEHIATQLGCGPDELLVGRTYQIVMDGRPVASIKESFAKHGILSPSVTPSGTLAQ